VPAPLSGPSRCVVRQCMQQLELDEAAGGREELAMERVTSGGWAAGLDCFNSNQNQSVPRDFDIDWPLDRELALWRETAQERKLSMGDRQPTLALVDDFLSSPVSTVFLPAAHRDREVA
jgi:hypothetical protein